MAAGTLDRGHDDEVLRASRVSRFSLTSPPSSLTAAAMGAVAGLIALVLWAGPARVAPEAALALAVGGLLVPAWAGAAASFALMRRLTGSVTWGRVFLLGLTDLTVVLAWVLIVPFLPTSAAGGWVFAVACGVAWAASVNMLVLAATSYPRMAVAALPGLLLPAGAIAALVAAGRADGPSAAAAGASVVAFMAASAGWARIVVAPFRRALGEDGLVLLQALLDAWAGWSLPPGREGRAKGTLAMEAFFARHGQTRDVRLRAAAFRRAGSADVLWVVPDLHPGPYADLGGSDLPAKVAGALPGKEVSTFHGASTHDENPCSLEDVGRASAAVLPALEGAASERQATRSVTVIESGVTLTLQRIGNQLVAVHSRAPASSDDIDRSVGEAAERAAVLPGAAGTTLLDAHNCVAADLGRTAEGSKEAEGLLAASAAALELLAVESAGALAVGHARRQLSPARARQFAVGRQGIAATVVEANAQKTAYILIDGNNLKAGLREPMLAAARRHVDAAEVLTTDNHAVNTTMGADNEVGSTGDNQPLIDEVDAAVRDAVSDLKPAGVAWASTAVEGVRVFGPGLTVRMSEAINAAVGRMIPVYMVAVAVAVAASWALWYRVA